MAESKPPRLRRNLSIWQAVGLSVALMAPSMAANINPQVTASTVGRAVPLAFLFAGVAILLVAYGFVRLCQYYQHAGSVYAFVGSTLGPRTGAVSGTALFGTYTFFGVVTSCAFGILGTNFLSAVGIWPHPPGWASYLLAAVALAGSLVLTVIPAKRGTTTLLSIEGATIVLILIVCAVVLVRLITGDAPAGGGQTFTLKVFAIEPDTNASTLFLGIVFGFLSFAGFEASSTLGEETAAPRKNIPRAILGTAIFGTLYFTIVTAIEVMGFGAGAKGVKSYAASSSLVGDLGRSFVAGWVGDVITLGAAISAFGCCLACVVGASRLMFAISRDVAGERGLATVTRVGTPGVAALTVVCLMGLIIIIDAFAFGAKAEDAFAWSGTIGTLIILVVYILTTIGAIRLLFIQRKMPVHTWEIVIPLAGIVVLVYTLYRNVLPYPPSNTAPFWFPIVAGAWLLACAIAVIAAPGTAARLGDRLAAEEGFMTDLDELNVAPRSTDV
ncbi:APC family permease [Leekyejoonella antrihumi]|uniref:APC family permease n=1 Tax=Leekyejoonella antrihumi TaxID=1660198 RepID=A0A563E3H2_9MICO|nr:APC family permease [Leekyejoonella antrihumi]TWP36772.1 APC family permease [Leekyejoonella antrihumi]